VSNVEPQVDDQVAGEGVAKIVHAQPRALVGGQPS
jgi:hypothetical protein